MVYIWHERQREFYERRLLLAVRSGTSASLVVGVCDEAEAVAVLERVES